MARHTLIINYAAMNLGGIEVYLSNLIKHCFENNYRVIWLTTPYCVERSDFKKITDDARVEKCFIKIGRHWALKCDLQFKEDENITMISCEPLHFLRAEKLRETYKNVCSFYHFLVLPHFTGNVYYPERFFSGRSTREKWFSFMRDFAERLNSNNCLLAFSLKHLVAYEDNYNILIKDKETKVLQRIKSPMNITEKELFDRASKRNNEFRIITCARFDFPHKGYFLGLLDNYIKLKDKYKQIKLVIVGYGEGLKEIKEKIAAMPAEFQKDIELTGALSQERLQEEFCKAHLNIGLAGALIDGAFCSLPSLLVRHYSYTCETYGFINQVEGGLLKSEKGEDLLPYVEKVLEWTDEQYVKQAKKDYQYACSRKKYNPNYLFEQKNTSSLSIIPKSSYLKARNLNFLWYLKRKIFHAPGYEEDQTKKAEKR